MTEPIDYKVFLKLETGSHSGRIRQILPTPDGKTLVTSGDDKTIRVWDIASKTQTRMLLGEIGPGEQGSIRAIALSPDGKYVVSLAWMYPNENFAADERETDLRVFELATGNLQAGFRFPGTLQELDFSSDGRYLTIVGNPKASKRHGYVYVYEAKQIVKGFAQNPTPLASDKLFNEDALIPSYVRFIPGSKNAREHRIVVATWIHHPGADPEYTGKLIWYSFSKTSKLKRVVQRETEALSTPDSLAVSREHAVINIHHGDVKRLYCHDHNGGIAFEIESETIPAQPVFSRDEKHLIVGQRGDSELVQVKVYALTPSRYELKSVYFGHDAETLGVALLEDGTAISAGGDQNAIHFWRTHHLEGDKIAEISGVGRIIHAVGINPDEQIGFGSRDTLRQEDGAIVLSRLFDLRTMRLKASSQQETPTYRRSQTTFNGRELKWMKQYGYINLYLQPDNIPFTGVYPVGWYFPTTFGFTEDGVIVTGANDGKIRVSLPNPDGSYEVPSRLLVGHSGSVTDHAASGRWLVSAGSDQVIRIWFMDDVKNNDQTDLDPALNLFVGSDDEWVIWSKSGYYEASQDGDARFGYHVNRGPDKEAIYFHSDRLFKTFYRPDIIRAILEHGSEERALAVLTKSGNKRELTDVHKVLPPIVELLEKGVVKKGDEATFKFSVTELNPEKPVKRVWIVQNDQFAWEEQKITGNYKVTLTLSPGVNLFKILAETESAKSMPVVQLIMGPPSESGGDQSGSLDAASGSWTSRGAYAAEAARAQANTIISNEDNGRLFILAVGVSKLKNETDDFKSLHYADADAISIFNAFGRSKFTGKLDKKGALKNKAFESVDATILLNEQGTKAAIFDAVDKISAKIKKRAAAKKPPRDVFLVYLSGHGVRRADSFERELYFWCYDLLSTNTRATGLSFIELGERITSLPVDVILATDACHSGMAGSDAVRGLDPNELAKRIYSINERGMYILNASGSEEYAREGSQLGHGVFTKSILEALQFETDMSMMSLMASIQRRVVYYTNHVQTPVFRMYGDLLPLTIFDK